VRLALLGGITVGAPHALECSVWIEHDDAPIQVTRRDGRPHEPSRPLRFRGTPENDVSALSIGVVDGWPISKRIFHRGEFNRLSVFAPFPGNQTLPVCSTKILCSVPAVIALAWPPHDLIKWPCESNSNTGAQKCSKMDTFSSRPRSYLTFRRRTLQDPDVIVLVHGHPPTCP